MNIINILHLYPNEMNTYGDHGNVLSLATRLSWHGYEPKIHYHHPEQEFPADIDIVIGGGGQDSAQAHVQEDILKIGNHLIELADKDTPMLMVCGMYQLFGHRYLTNEGKDVKGIGIFDAETIGGSQRMIGNVIVKTELGLVYGFENHSGQTMLIKAQRPFGKVKRGKGNNGRDKTEGARTNNVFGTYLHGPFLPNNPKVCDELIKLACQNRYGGFEPRRIDDSLVEKTLAAAKKRSY